MELPSRALAARALAGLPFESEARYISEGRALICAIDSCVAYDLEIYRRA